LPLGAGKKILGLDGAMGVRKCCEEILEANTCLVAQDRRRLRFERVEGL
jgi:hypothetical protein